MGATDLGGLLGVALSGALLVYAAATPWESLATPVGTPVQVAGLLLLAVWFTSWIAGSTQIYLPPAVTVTMSILIGWTLLTSLWSAAPLVSLVAGASRTFLVLSALVVAHIRPHLLARFVQVLAISTGLVALSVLASHPTQVRDDTTTFNGIDQNILAFNLAIGLAGAIYLILAAPNRGSLLLNAALTVVIAISIVLTGSRTGLVSVIAVVGLAGVVGLRGRRLGFSLLVVIIAAVAWWLALLSGRIPERILGFVGAPVTMDSRELIIDQYLEYRDAWEIWGIGAGADADFLSQVSGYYKNAHSGFWKTWVEVGLIGLLITAALVVVCIVSARRSPARRLLFIAIGAVVPFMYTLGPINSNALWVLVGLCLIPSTPTQRGDEIDTPRPWVSRR